MEEKKGFVGYLYCYQLYNESADSLLSVNIKYGQGPSFVSQLRAEQCSILCTVAARSDFFHS